VAINGDKLACSEGRNLLCLDMILDGGICLYALKPETDEMAYSHTKLGPYEDHSRGHGHTCWSEEAGLGDLNSRSA
jgi:hypothetical protein